MNDERLKYWSTAVALRTLLGEIDGKEIDRVPEEDDGVYYLAGLLLAAEGKEPEESVVMKMAEVIRSNLLFEGLRRRYGAKRPRLFVLRDLPVSRLHEKMEIPEREFMWGLAYMIREKTGRELTAEEAAQEAAACL